MGATEERHILVIEESRALRDAMQEILGREGFRVTTTGGGAEARDLLERGATQFDLIVVNLHLPPSSGFDALEWLRARRGHLPIPILGLTGPAKLAATVERLRGLAAVGVLDTRTLEEQLPYRVRGLLYPQGRNRRAGVRAASGVLVNCRAGQARMQGTIGNISRTGMFVNLEPPLEAGQEVSLQFILPAIPRLFEARARVVWTARVDQGAAASGVGMEFLGLDEGGAREINAWVHRELEQAGRGSGTSGC